MDGVLARAYKRVSAQTHRERELTVEMSQGEIVSGVVGERIQARCLGVPGLETLRVNPDFVRLFGQKSELRLFKGWLVKDGKQLPRRQQLDRYSGQVEFDVIKGVHIKTEGKEVDGVLFMASGGTLIEVYFGNVEQLKLRYGKKERVLSPSADKVAKEAIEKIERNKQREE